MIEAAIRPDTTPVETRDAWIGYNLQINALELDPLGFPSMAKMVAAAALVANKAHNHIAVHRHSALAQCYVNPAHAYYQFLFGDAGGECSCQQCKWRIRFRLKTTSC